MRSFSACRVALTLVNQASFSDSPFPPIRQLRQLAEAIRSVLGNWPPKVVAELGFKPNQPITWQVLLRLIHTSDADKLRTQIQDHVKRVRWHLMRLYRIRCYLVHGTSIETALQLPAANLEYYLREAIIMITRAFDRIEPPRSVESVIQRASYANSRRDEFLGAKNAGRAEIQTALECAFTFSLET